MAMRRFRVTEASMLPALAPGDEVAAVDDRRPVVGDVVVFPHPEREGFWMIKRAARPPEPIGADRMWALSDNAEVTRADSRTFGPVPAGSALRVVDRLDAETHRQACALLASEDRALARAIDRFGAPELRRRRPGLPTLTLLVLEQQVSLESAAALFARLAEAAGDVSAGSLARLGAEGMRSIGVTRRKADCLAGLAERAISGELDFGALDDDPGRVARERLTTLRGIGPWTADTYLLSAQGRPDVFPVGDRALRVGAAETLGLGSVPGEEELRILGEPWRPVRAAAARIIWRAYMSKRGRKPPPDPRSVRAEGPRAAGEPPDDPDARERSQQV